MADLVSGSAVLPVTFYSPGNQAVTATDISDGTKKGVSDLITVLSGTTSTLLNVVHTSPALSGQGLGAVGVTFMTFQLSVASGTDAVQLNSLVIHEKDTNGSDVPYNTALQNLSVLSGSQTFVTSVGSVSSAVVTLGAFPAGNLPGPTRYPSDIGFDRRCFGRGHGQNYCPEPGQAASFSAIDKSTSTSVAVLATSDPTGFPMSSGTLMLEPADVSKTFGNYPNPFRPGVETPRLSFIYPRPPRSRWFCMMCSGTRS